MSARALIVDDHPVICDAVASSLISLEVFEEIDSVGSLRQLLDKLKNDATYQLIIMDLSLMDISGSGGLARVREEYPRIPIIIFSASDSVDIIAECFDYGVQGFVSKNESMHLLVNAIRMVLDGGVYIPHSIAGRVGVKASIDTAGNAAGDQVSVSFTPKQQAVFDQLMLGAPNKIISSRLNLAEGTVKAHLHNIYQTLGVKNRAQAILKAQRLQLI